MTASRSGRIVGAVPGWIVCDIGANIGWYSLLAATKVGARGKVFAFEPAPEEFTRLERNVQLNGLSNIALQRLAVSDTVGDAWLGPPGDAGTTHLVSAGYAQARLIRATTLDRFVVDHALARLDLVKVDIEGAEGRFIDGARKALERFRPVLMIELHEKNLLKFGSSPEIIVRQLTELGYAAYRPTRQGLARLHALPRGDCFFNAVCVQRDQLDTELVPWRALEQPGHQIGGPRDGLIRT
ncbi:MAG: FkbM family methyltransferase [Chloroflexi bacterium]|nr:FkbM family methyltransferase [Chloroflexota bacterium]